MKKITCLEEVEILLFEIREKIRENDVVFMARPKNSRTLAKWGIMAKRLNEVFDKLTATDFCAGPNPDEKYPWKSVYVFGLVFQGIELYIKFSVSDDNSPVMCLSFHEAEHPMAYRFK